MVLNEGAKPLNINFSPPLALNIKIELKKIEEKILI